MQSATEETGVGDEAVEAEKAEEGGDAEGSVKAEAGSSSSSCVPHADEDGEGAPPKRKKPKWLPLESNPDILNEFFERVGVATACAFTDVWGLDPALLAMVPQPVLAVCMLFPSGPVRKPRLEALEGGEDARRAPGGTFYLIQHRVFGNACGTIAAVHAIGNLAQNGTLELVPGSPIQRFLETSGGKDPAELGHDLAAADELHEASENVARSRRAQTRTPGHDDKVDGHFVTFVLVDGLLVELDGCMGFPISHGPSTPASLLADAAQVIREEFMARAPGNPNFSVMALVGQQGDMPSPEAAGAGDLQIDSEALANLMAMGFGEDQATEAWRAAGGNVEQAVSILLG